MANLGPTELIIILFIVIIIFGVGRLPELGGALGEGIREFRNATRQAEEASEELKSTMDTEDDNEKEA